MKRSDQEDFGVSGNLDCDADPMLCCSVKVPGEREAIWYEGAAEAERHIAAMQAALANARAMAADLAAGRASREKAEASPTATSSPATYSWVIETPIPGGHAYIGGQDASFGLLKNATPFYNCERARGFLDALQTAGNADRAYVCQRVIPVKP